MILQLPDAQLLPPLVTQAGLERDKGFVRRTGRQAGLGPAENAILQVERLLGNTPFQPPATPELQKLGLGPRELAAAERDGRLLRLTADVVLLPDGPARAMRVLATLVQPFTTSEARNALGTTGGWPYRSWSISTYVAGPSESTRAIGG